MPAALIPVAAGIIIIAAIDWTEEAENPVLLRIGVLPDQTSEELAARYGPLLVHLAHETGLPCELKIPGNYDELLQMFDRSEIELAYFGGLTFLKALKSNGAIPIAMRGVDARFRSYFLVAAADPAKSIEDMGGGTLAFGSRLSTSGHLMPRYFLARMGIEPETYFGNIVYSGSHDATAYLVRDGDAGLGAANAEIIERMFKDGRLNRNKVRVLWRTPPYPNYTWAIRGEISGDIRQKVQDAFLALSPGTANHAEILRNLGAESFVPASINDFIPLRNIAEAQGLLD